MDELERIPCVDGSCVGTLGPDGRCTYCGLEGDEVPQRLEGAEAASPGALDDDDDPDRWTERRLCADGSCVGTLGPDGRCYVCGLEGA